MKVDKKCKDVVVFWSVGECCGCGDEGTVFRMGDHGLCLACMVMNMSEVVLNNEKVEVAS